MARLASVVLGLGAVLALAGCSPASRGAADASSPAAAIGPGLERLAGRWQGTMTETGAHLYQGFSTIDVQIDETGAWTGKIGGAPASGTARLEGGRLIVTGTTGASDGPQLPVYVSLRGDDSRRWGQMAAVFAGRRAPAMVELERQSP
jgi:hypothetical protein